MIFLDALSVATRGFLEADLPLTGGTPGPPVAQVAPIRDSLRIATRGYIILPIPGPGTIICVEVKNGLPNDFEVAEHATAALLAPESGDAVLAPEFTDAEAEPGDTIAELEPEFISAVFKPSPTDADADGQTGVQLLPTRTKLGIESPSTVADVEPDDTDFDPQDQC